MQDCIQRCIMLYSQVFTRKVRYKMHPVMHHMMLVSQLKEDSTWDVTHNLYSEALKIFQWRMQREVHQAMNLVITIKKFKRDSTWGASSDRSHDQGPNITWKLKTKIVFPFNFLHFTNKVHTLIPMPTLLPFLLLLLLFSLEFYEFKLINEV